MNLRQQGRLESVWDYKEVRQGRAIRRKFRSQESQTLSWRQLSALLLHQGRVQPSDSLELWGL